MGPRITTWNVNGIRNPFGYQPWRSTRTFEGMFDILEADIVVLQECKIQRKDLRDDMVLVPGWDAFFSLPKHKKGYSGVAIYTRNAVCAPIRAEEGITGILTRPNSDISYFDLPEDEQIGGYPSITQLDSTLDAATLDSEGRCVVLEFPAFVLIGTYCPANRDETRDEFRIGFLQAVDARIRNLVAMGKRVFWTGDLNIIREEVDTANAEEQMKKQNLTPEDYVSTPARRLLNQLLVGGKVYNDRDEGREKSILWDICRGFHPERKGMFTCWETKTNARPGNFGSRIDYVLCSENWKDWFSASDIQEGLLGSDHCPVYAILKDRVTIDNQEVDIREIMNSPGTFVNGKRVREWSQKDLLPLSAKLIPEFDRRRNIRDMFTRKPSTLKIQDSTSVLQDTPENHDDDLGTKLSNPGEAADKLYDDEQGCVTTTPLSAVNESLMTQVPLKRSLEPAMVLTSKKSKLSSPKPAVTSKPSKQAYAVGKGAVKPAMKGQSSLTGFFKPKAAPASVLAESTNHSAQENKLPQSPQQPITPDRVRFAANNTMSTTPEQSLLASVNPSIKEFSQDSEKPFIDPIVAKESWDKLLSKRVKPLCEHAEPCVSFLTKKPGVNCGRSFYMCPRPLGPSGVKEKNTQWRCGTFIWSSDWSGDSHA